MSQSLSIFGSPFEYRPFSNQIEIYYISMNKICVQYYTNVSFNESHFMAPLPLMRIEKSIEQVI